MAFHPFLAAAVSAGGYISFWKVLPVIAVLLGWARLLAWADKDTLVARLPREGLNSAMLGGFILGFGLFLFVPNFWGGFGALTLLFLGEVGAYLGLRNKSVGLADLKEEIKNAMKGRKKETEIEIPPDRVQFMQGSAFVPAPAVDTPERPSFETAQEALTEPLMKSAEQIDLAPEENGLAVKYTVDGVSFRGPLLDRVQGAAAISFMKQVAGMDVEDRRKPQSGTLKAAVDAKKFELRVQTAGTRAGEYLRIVVNPKKRHDTPLDKLGFSEAQLGKVKESITKNQGIVLVAAPKGHGLTSIQYALIRAHDGFVQHLQSIERDAEQDIEGVTQNKLAPTATAEEELKLVSWIMSQEPDVIMMSKVEDRQTATDLIGFVKEGKRVYIGMRAGSTFEALEQWVKLVGDPALAIEAVDMVISGRLLRKLCVACKVAYNPDPATLKKLSINPESVSTLYQARSEPTRNEGGVVVPCEFCKDLFYKGRSGVFETLVVDDDVREVVKAGKSPSQAFRKQRGKYLQEEALSLVEKGETSVQEMLRVLRGGSGEAGAAARAAGASPPNAPKAPAAPAPSGARTAPSRPPSKPGAAPAKPGAAPAKPGAAPARPKRA